MYSDTENYNLEFFFFDRIFWKHQVLLNLFTFTIFVAYKYPFMLSACQKQAQEIDLSSIKLFTKP